MKTGQDPKMKGPAGIESTLLLRERLWDSSGGVSHDRDYRAGKKCIAVVDDNPDNAFLMVAMLEDHYEVSVYASGREALAGVRSNPPDLILLDLSMPGMTGYEVLEILRDDPDLSHIPVLACTAHTRREDYRKCMAAGFDGHIGKPIVDQDQLLETISHYLDTY